MSIAVQQYLTMLSAIQGVFANALDSHDPTTPKARTELRTELVHCVNAAAIGIFDSIQRDVLQASDMAIQEIGTRMGVVMSEDGKSSLMDHIGEIADSTCFSVALCAKRDAETASATLRKVSMEVELMRLSGKSKVGALIQSKFGAVRNLSFFQPDRLGRKSSSADFVARLIQHSVVLAGVESKLFYLSKLGRDLAVTTGSDKPMVFSITGSTPGYPSYEEIRDSLFHPNSNLSVEGTS